MVRGGVHIEYQVHGTSLPFGSAFCPFKPPISKAFKVLTSKNEATKQGSRHRTHGTHVDPIPGFKVRIGFWNFTPAMRFLIPFFGVWSNITLPKSYGNYFYACNSGRRCLSKSGNGPVSQETTRAFFFPCCASSSWTCIYAAPRIEDRRRRRRSQQVGAVAGTKYRRQWIQMATQDG